MALALLHPLANQLARAVEQDKMHLAVYLFAQTVAIGMFECRARYYHAVAGNSLHFHPLADGFKPRPSVFVRQSNSAGHLLDVGGGMQGIALHKRYAQPLR